MCPVPICTRVFGTKAGLTKHLNSNSQSKEDTAPFISAPKYASGGQAPKHVSSGQAPKNVSLSCGQVPKIVSGGQAPKIVSGGQGQAPKIVSGGQAPKTVQPVKNAAEHDEDGADCDYGDYTSSDEELNAQPLPIPGLEPASFYTALVRQVETGDKGRVVLAQG